MFRTVFVIVALIVGWLFAFQSPLYAAGLYLWIAYFRPESWAWDTVFQTLNLSYIAGAFLIGRTLLSPTPVRFDFRRFLLFLFLGHALISTALAPDVAYSFGYWQEFAKTIIVSYLLTLIVTTTVDLRFILTVVVLSLGFEAAKQGWVQLVMNPGAANMNTIPFLGDNNLVAVGMAMLMPLCLALARTSPGVWQRRFFQLLAIGTLYRALSTYSRGGFLAVGAVGLIYFVRSQHKMRTVLAGLLAVAIILPAMPPAFWARMSTITADSGERDESQQGRLHFWAVAVAMANDNPVFGVGHSGYPRAYNRYDTSEGAFKTSRAVHSAWFGVLAELGYPGLAMFITILFLSLRACRRVRLMAARGEVPDTLGYYAIGLEASLVAFMVGGSFVSFHYCEMLWHFFAFTISLEQAALAERAAIHERVDAPAPPVQTIKPVPDFVWA